MEELQENPKKGRGGLESEAIQNTDISKKNTPLFVLLGIEDARARRIFSFILLIILSSAVLSFLLLPPSKFPIEEIVTIKKDVSLGQVSVLFKEQNVIRSRFLFELCTRAIGGEKRVIAGSYLFDKPIGSCSVAFRITRGISGVPMLKITIPEGSSNKEIANIFAREMHEFNTEEFIDHARSREGYLFPDTYFFESGATTEQIIALMEQNFNDKIAPLNSAIKSSERSLRDIIIMASILEREAATKEDQKNISGILWKRIDQGIPLQVDAPFMYLLGKKSSELTRTDLQIKSVYNTYRNKGLPGGPIGNPGISAIEAALYPTKSPYFYYLSDDKGNMYYSKTFAEHVANKNKYLK